MSRAAKSVTVTLPFQLALAGERSGRSTATASLCGEHAGGQRHIGARLDVGTHGDEVEPRHVDLPRKRHGIGGEHAVPRDASALTHARANGRRRFRPAGIRIVRGSEREVAYRELHGRLGHTILDVDRRSLDQQLFERQRPRSLVPGGAGRFGRLHDARDVDRPIAFAGKLHPAVAALQLLHVHAAHGEVEIDTVRRDVGQDPERLPIAGVGEREVGDRGHALGKLHVAVGERARNARANRSSLSARRRRARPCSTETAGRARTSKDRTCRSPRVRAARRRPLP